MKILQSLYLGFTLVGVASIIVIGVWMMIIAVILRKPVHLLQRVFPLTQ